MKPKPGVEAAPLALIKAGLLDSLRNDLEFVVHHDNQVHDFVEVFPASDPPLIISNARVPMLNSFTVSNVTRAISTHVYEHASKNRLVLTLGGTIPSLLDLLQALQRLFVSVMTEGKSL